MSTPPTAEPSGPCPDGGCELADGLDCDLGWVFEVSFLLRAHLDGAAAEIGLTPTQARVLVHLVTPRRVSALAELQVCDVSSMTTLLQRMERDGLVERLPDPTDGRARLISLTGKGADHRSRFLELANAGERALGQLSDTARSEIRRAL